MDNLAKKKKKKPQGQVSKQAQKVGISNLNQEGQVLELDNQEHATNPEILYLNEHHIVYNPHYPLKWIQRVRCKCKKGHYCCTRKILL